MCGKKVSQKNVILKMQAGKWPSKEGVESEEYSENFKAVSVYKQRPLDDTMFIGNVGRSIEATRTDLCTFSLLVYTVWPTTPIDITW